VIIAVGLAAGAMGLGGCASSHTAQPAWLQEREATVAQGYPTLQSVPRTNIAETDPAHWASVEADVMAAGQELKSNPRAQPAPAEDAAGFLDDARATLETTRQSHE
jgi:hypothetical protein